MNLKTTKIYEQVVRAYLDHKRHIWLEGGTAASKTWSILQLLYLIGLSSKEPLLISVTAESMPHIRRGALRDFMKILGDNFNPDCFNKTTFTYNFPKAQIEFFSVDQSDRLRGARRDILFCNEINNFSRDAFRELDARTRLCTIADWNPVSEFFVYSDGLLDAPDSVFIHATYKDALNVVPPEVIENIEQMGERDANWANVYLLGRLGKIEGLVYPSFEQVDSLPGGDAFYGLDFGFSGDPTALVKCMLIGDQLYIQELVYQTGLTNQDLSQMMADIGIRKNYDEIWADSAEPKSIEEIYRYGFNIKGCTKGADSVEYGQQRVRQYKLMVTKDSLNLIKELRNFRYIEDKKGILTSKTTHTFSHALDATRYAVAGKTEIKAIPKLWFVNTGEE